MFFVYAIENKNFKEFVYPDSVVIDEDVINVTIKEDRVIYCGKNRKVVIDTKNYIVEVNIKTSSGIQIVKFYLVKDAEYIFKDSDIVDFFQKECTEILKKPMIDDVREVVLKGGEKSIIVRQGKQKFLLGVIQDEEVIVTSDSDGTYMIFYSESGSCFYISNPEKQYKQKVKQRILLEGDINLYIKKINADKKK